MKKTNFSFKQISFFLVFVLLLIFVFNPLDSAGFVRGAFLKIGHPFLKAFYFSGEKIKKTVGFVSSISSLEKENEELIVKNNFLEKEMAKFQGLEKENEELRKQLELAPREKFDLEAARVINRSSFGSGSWLMIDKGKNQGVSKNMPVVVYNGVLVGKVKEVFANKARILLLSDPESVINAKDVKTGTRGLVKGKYGLGIFLDMVEQGESINEGDLVVTSGLGANLPENLLIGKLQGIQVSQDKLFQQAVISPQIEYSSLKIVFVIKK